MVRSPLDGGGNGATRVHTPVLLNMLVVKVVILVIVVMLVKMVMVMLVKMVMVMVRLAPDGATFADQSSYSVSLLCTQLVDIGDMDRIKL